MDIQSIELNELDILWRFSVMEKHFPRCVGKFYFPSLDFYLNYFDNPIDSIKKEADNMFAFVGMGMYTTRISIGKLDGAAGTIHLTNDMYADICINEDGYQEIDYVMATLAHELCHKILYKNCIYFDKFMDIENEIYADLATFYVGFGDLTMKGYRLNFDGKTHSSGYLTPTTYAMAYYIMTVINNNVKYNLDRLPPHAKSEIESVMKRRPFDSLCGISIESIQSYFGKASSELSQLKLLCDKVITSLLMNVNSMQSKYKSLHSAFYGTDNSSEFNWHRMDMAYHYLSYTNQNGITNDYVKLVKLKEAMVFILDILTENSLVNIADSSNMNNNKVCPICNHPINRPLENRTYHFICPNCKSHFIIDNDNDKVADFVKGSRATRDNIKKELANLSKIKEDNLIYKNTVNQLRKKVEDLQKELDGKWYNKLFHNEK